MWYYYYLLTGFPSSERRFKWWEHLTIFIFSIAVSLEIAYRVDPETFKQLVKSFLGR